MADRKNEILDFGKVENAIGSVIDLLAEKELTIAECVKVVRALDVSFKALHPQVYDIISRI